MDDDDWDEDDEELGDDEYVEQVCDIICPHCRQPLQLVVAPPGEDEALDDDDDEGV